MAAKKVSAFSAKVAAAARGHFDAMKGQSVEIPEWDLGPDDDGQPVVFFDPPTLRTRQSIQSRCGTSQSRQFALTVILCLKDADGAAVFADDAASLALLENEADPQVVARVFNKIISVTEGEALGN